MTHSTKLMPYPACASVMIVRVLTYPLSYLYGTHIRLRHARSSVPFCRSRGRGPEEKTYQDLAAVSVGVTPCGR